MITTNCDGCGRGPMDLPGDELCDECRIEARNEDSLPFEDDLDDDDDEYYEYHDA